MIERRLLRDSTADVPDSLEDIVLRDRDGVVRTFGPYANAGPITAGDRVFTWQDEQHLWALPSGQTEPIVLVTTDEESTAYAMAHGPWLFLFRSSWLPDGSFSRQSQLVRTDCPA